MNVARQRPRPDTRLAALAAAFVVVIGIAPAAHSVGTRAGTATVKSKGGDAILNSGDSGTTFTLRLPTPPESACPGDTPNDGYRVQSYMVPASVDPGTLTFGVDGPQPPAFSGPDFRQPLYDTFGTGFVDFNTVATPGSPRPQPGPIVNIPDFNYAAFGPGAIDPGTYNIGIACTVGPAGPDQLKTYYNVQVTFTTNPSGGFSEVSWTADQAATTTTIAGGSTTTTAAGGATTTTAAGGTTTTAAGGTTTTTRPGSTTTAPGGSTTSAPSTTVASSTASTPLARAGGDSTWLIVWAAVLLVLGRMAVLVARHVRAGPSE